MTIQASEQGLIKAVNRIADALFAIAEAVCNHQDTTALPIVGYPDRCNVCKKILE